MRWQGGWWRPVSGWISILDEVVVQVRISPPWAGRGLGSDSRCRQAGENTVSVSRGVSREREEKEGQAKVRGRLVVLSCQNELIRDIACLRMPLSSQQEWILSFYRVYGEGVVV